MKIDLVRLRELAKANHDKCFGRGYIGTSVKDGGLFICGCVRKELKKRGARTDKEAFALMGPKAPPVKEVPDEVRSPS